MMAVVALILDLCITKAKALNQTTHLLVKLECFEIILFNAIAFFIHKSKIRAKVCGLNDGSGCYNLGLMYEKGKGVKQDDFKALILFNAIASVIHKSKKRATTAIIQTTR
jgi:hypothetical protein